jgi:eukaryotic-like serine/threonine-protein kinase
MTAKGGPMPLPTTAAEFVDLVRKSGVVEEKRLDAHLNKLRADSCLPVKPNELAGVLVRDGILTHFQAQQFLQGKWRGFTIGKYKVLEQLGSGGMGSVYLCEHSLMRRRVAVKVLPKAKADDPAALDRFYREARAVAALDHPNIVRAYDIDQADKLHFLVMEYVDGSSLQQIIKKTGPMDLTRTCHYVRQAALGLQHAHEANLVHRDIKPGNILVDRNGIVKVLDMGLARFFNDEEDAITRKYEENVLGTADYLAPEQALDSHSVDIRADLYSLGATFYFCLTGRTPFAEGTVAQKLIWHQTRQPKPIRMLRADVPEELAGVIERMMAKRPEDRYQSPLAVADALAPWTRNTIPPPPDREMPHLSLAAMGSGSTGSGSDSALREDTTTGSGGPPSPSVRRSWQVSVTPPPAPAQTTAPIGPASPRSGPAPRTPTHPIPRPAPSSPLVPPVVNPAPAPVVRPIEAATPPPPPAIQSAPPVAPAPAPQQITTLPALDPASETSPWRQFATNDTEPITSRSPSSRRFTRRTPNRASPVLYFLIGGLLFLGVAGGALVFWLLHRDNEPKKDEPPRSTTHYVGDGASDLRKISEALDRAQPGDRIIVRKPHVFESVILTETQARNLHHIRIEADPNMAPIHWGLSKKEQISPLLRLNDATGFQIEGFAFDGENKLEILVQLNCCKGVTLKNVQLRGYTKSGVQVNNCMGTAQQPILLEALSANSNNPPLEFRVIDGYFRSGFVCNDHVIVQNCKFVGNFKIPMEDLMGGENEGVQLPPDLKKRVVKVGKKGR